LYYYMHFVGFFGKQTKTYIVSYFAYAWALLLNSCASKNC
jgi:hypothetical protein